MKEDREHELDMWTVYNRPRDYPDRYVARRWVTGPSGVIEGKTLEEVRAGLPPGLHCLPRTPADDAVIVETWL